MKLKNLLLTCTFLSAIAAVAVAQTAEVTKPIPPSSPTATAFATTGSEISVSGKVVSSTSTELVIETDLGQRMTFTLDATTHRASSFTNGERVSVRYHSLSGGTVFHAANIGIEPAPMAEPRIDEGTDYAASNLPKTASNLPLIGLLGFLAAGGAVAVRVLRR